MSDFSEAVGSAVEGSLASRAVEPGAGDKAAHGQAGAKCLNCGTALIGNNCHNCGQKAVIHRTISAFMHDLLHGALHFEGKIWRTLPKLIIKPGELTRRYIDGERARFVSPMALFLFSVFLMFAVFQVAGISTPTTINSPGSVEASEGLETVRSETADRAEEMQAELAEMAEGDPRRAELEEDLAGLRMANEQIDSAAEMLSSDSANSMEFSGVGIDWIDEGLIQKWRDNPGLMLYKMQNNSYKFSWLLIPISIPFVWIMFFWKRRFRAYDHAIFVTYSLAFMSLLFLTLSVLGKLGVPIPALILSGIFIPPIHIYKQLRGGYELSRLGAFWRTWALTNMILFGVAIIFLWLLLLLGAF